MNIQNAQAKSDINWRHYLAMSLNVAKSFVDAFFTLIFIGFVFSIWLELFEMSDFIVNCYLCFSVAFGLHKLVKEWEQKGLPLDNDITNLNKKYFVDILGRIVKIVVFTLVFYYIFEDTMIAYAAANK
ncbi:MAG: hypothetical protein CL760_09685 [Chloroflexi bacterium]|nr:hypothetical protein [Chloroflexota bacterium]|tara:strand:+ start:7475 stop:7858 length:384 start_codon:yes stop_codon:yes gene_type:complete